MSKHESPRRLAESAEVTITRTISTRRKRTFVDAANGMKIFASNEKEKERVRTSYSNNHKEKRKFMQRIGSGTQAKLFARKHKGEVLQDRKFDICNHFQLMKLSNQDIDDECSLNMTSIDSRPSSCVSSAAFEERISKNDGEVETLQISSAEAQEDINAERGHGLKLIDGKLPEIQPDTTPKTSNIEEDKLKCDLESMDTNIQSGIENESTTVKKSIIKSAWELSDKYHLTTDFRPEVWDNKQSINSSKTKILSLDPAVRENFPRLTAVAERRRGSFPTTRNFLSPSSALSELPSLSGKSCKVQLPSKFPGVSSAPSENESGSSENKTSSERKITKASLISKREHKQEKPFLEVPPGNRGQVTALLARASPESSKSSSPMLSPKNLTMEAASNEYLAARVVTQLNAAFEETCFENDDDITGRSACVTPNLVPRRHSAMFVRSNTNNFFEGKAHSAILPSVGKACSKSLPNLSSREKPKRVFVTFEKDSPRAQVVDLKGRGDVADKCRLLNKKLTRDDAIVEKILQQKIHKKAMIKKWVIASAQYD